MEDDSDGKDETKRRTRNLSEKKRRDTFNMLVNELCSMVSTNNRKMDKSTVLKSTISFLKNHNEITVRSRAHDVQEDWKPTFVSNEEFTYLMLEALEGFVLVFSATGQIHYVSESVTSLLGHNPVDMINRSIFDLAFEEDLPNLYSLLQNPTRAIDPTQPLERDNEINFKCHLRRSTLDFRDEPSYELIQFNGHFRTNTENMNAKERTGYQDRESRLLFVCTGRLYTPQLIRDVSLADSNRNEFTSRYSLEWKFLFLDHRAPPIIGYLPFEVLGTSGYDYYHFDDLEKVVSCHEELMQKGELTSCYYRFLTKGQQWIWLQTRFYISYHQWNSKPEFVVCTHRVVSYADVAKSMKLENGEAELATELNTEVATEVATEVVTEMATKVATEVASEVASEVATEAVAEAETNRAEIRTSTSKDAMATMSSTYISEVGDTYPCSYQPLSQPASVKSASAGSTSGTVTTVGTAATTATSWPCTSLVRYTGGSDTASVSGESRSSQWNSSRESKSAATGRARIYGLCHGNMMMMCPQTHKGSESAPMPQHGVGTQYLEPAPFVQTVGVPAVLPVPLPSLPVIVTPDQAQMQEQLQRKHEELKQMIVRQQEELRQVKEQLLLARLGILQPLINVPNPYVSAEEIQQNQRILYDGGQTRTITGYPQQQPPSSSGHHPHMPQ